jgi:hypothetical protein
MISIKLRKSGDRVNAPNVFIDGSLVLSCLFLELKKYYVQKRSL